MPFLSRLLSETLTADDRHAISVAILTLFALALFLSLSYSTLVIDAALAGMVQLARQLGYPLLVVFLSSVGLIGFLVLGYTARFVRRGLFIKSGKPRVAGPVDAQ